MEQYDTLRGIDINYNETKNCEDDPEWSYESNEGIIKCSDLSPTDSRCNFFNDFGETGFEKCPVSCGNCFNLDTGLGNVTNTGYSGTPSRLYDNESGEVNDFTEYQGSGNAIDVQDLFYRYTYAINEKMDELTKRISDIEIGGMLSADDPDNLLNNVTCDQLVNETDENNCQTIIEDVERINGMTNREVREWLEGLDDNVKSIRIRDVCRLSCDVSVNEPMPLPPSRPIPANESGVLPDPTDPTDPRNAGTPSSGTHTHDTLTGDMIKLKVGEVEERPITHIVKNEYIWVLDNTDIDSSNLRLKIGLIDSASNDIVHPNGIWLDSSPSNIKDIFESDEGHEIQKDKNHYIFISLSNTDKEKINEENTILIHLILTDYGSNPDIIQEFKNHKEIRIKPGYIISTDPNTKYVLSGGTDSYSITNVPIKFHKNVNNNGVVLSIADGYFKSTVDFSINYEYISKQNTPLNSLYTREKKMTDDSLFDTSTKLIIFWILFGLSVLVGLVIYFLDSRFDSSILDLVIPNNYRFLIFTLHIGLCIFSGVYTYTEINSEGEIDDSYIYLGVLLLIILNICYMLFNPGTTAHFDVFENMEDIAEMNKKIIVGLYYILTSITFIYTLPRYLLNDIKSIGKESSIYLDEIK
jgi:hypothetical protein